MSGGSSLIQSTGQGGGGEVVISYLVMRAVTSVSASVRVCLCVCLYPVRER